MWKTAGDSGSKSSGVFARVIHTSVTDIVWHSGRIVKPALAEKVGYMAAAARTMVLEDESDVAQRLRIGVREAFVSALNVARAGNFP
jgi:hypothetical protein